MKKIIAIVLALTVLLCATACAGEQPNEVPQITLGPQENNNLESTGSGSDETSGQTVEGDPYGFTFSNVNLNPGDAFDAAKLPAATSTFQVPSCALEGTDNVYDYGAIEVTAFNDGKKEYIYSIYLKDPNTTTDEGLALGDTLDKAVSLYGNGYTQQDSACIYESAKTQLILILQGNSIVSIEYRLVTQ